MAQKGGGIIHTLVKPTEDSSMNYEESGNLYFWTSKLEELVKGLSERLIWMI
jgi:hypothetical protein